MLEAKPMRDMYSDEQIETACRYMNAILQYISEGGYEPGCRNNTMVDLFCVAHVLGFDRVETSNTVFEVVAFGLNERVDVIAHLKRIEPYLDSWDLEVNGVFSKMLDEDYWKELSKDAPNYITVQA